MNGKLNVAIVGCGRMGIQHARAVRSLHETAHLCALIDRSAPSLENAARLLPGVPTFSSLAEATLAMSIDAVHVCTPQQTHFAVAEDAIRRQCHVLVEKPFTRTSAEAVRLFEEAELRGLSMCAGHQLLFEPAYRALLQRLPLLGEIAHIESYFAFAPSRLSSGEAGLSPDEQLMDILPHPLYLLLDALRAAAPRGKTEVRDVTLTPTGTLHALVHRGGISATLIVTLSGRPVESTIRVVGTAGEVVADLVRGISREQLGPGRSAIDKIAAPYQQAWQMVRRTTGVLTRRVLRRQRDYPSLSQLVAGWYRSITTNVASPTPRPDVIDVVAAFESILDRVPLGATGARAASDRSRGRRKVIVTGGTGWLGVAVTQELLREGAAVVVLSRRAPASWRRVAGVEYVATDLGRDVDLASHADAECVIHCAAETAGGTAAHVRNSVKATENLIAAMTRAGIRRLVHVSSMAVLHQDGRPVAEQSAHEPDPVACGPYTWGKTESEKLVLQASAIDSRVVRPGAIVDSANFDPPGKLGKRLGPAFVAVGGLNEQMGVVELSWAARALAWIGLHFEQSPKIVNLLDPVVPTRRDLLRRLRSRDPGLVVLRIPRPAISLIGVSLLAASRVLRPGKSPIDIRRVFARQRFDSTGVRALHAQMERNVPLAAVNVASSNEPRRLSGVGADT